LADQLRAVAVNTREATGDEANGVGNIGDQRRIAEEKQRGERDQRARSDDRVDGPCSHPSREQRNDLIPRHRTPSRPGSQFHGVSFEIAGLSGLRASRPSGQCTQEGQKVCRTVGQTSGEVPVPVGAIGHVHPHNSAALMQAGLLIDSNAIQQDRRLEPITVWPTASGTSSYPMPDSVLCTLLLCVTQPRMTPTRSSRARRPVGRGAWRIARAGTPLSWSARSGKRGRRCCWWGTRPNTVQLDDHGFFRWSVGLGPVVVAGSFDVPLGVLAFDHAGVGPRSSSG
jgi:hypothetical protein